MNREDSGDKRTCPYRGRHFFQGQKKQNRGEAMQQHAHKMMPAGPEAEQLTIHHVRNRRERMPVLRMNVRERPSNAVPAQAGANVRVLDHVSRVVIIDELKAKRLTEDRPGDRKDKNADSCNQPT